jgi:glycosyltransferase involved in cell wall biosynthesis
MKICIISPNFPPKRCGIGDYTYFLSKALVQKGYDVTVLTSVYPTITVDEDNFKVLGSVEGWGIKHMFHLLALIKKINPMIVHIQYCPHLYHRRGLTFTINVIALLLRIFTKYKVITTFHELYIPFGWSLKKILGGIWQRLMAVVIGLGSHRVIVTCGLWKKFLKRLIPWKRIEIIPVGSNIPFIPLSNEEKKKIRKKVSKNEPTFLLGTFGTLHPSRDYELILKTLKELISQDKKIKFIWIGDPGSELLLEKIKKDIEMLKLNDSFVFTKYCSSEEISRLLQILDIYVAPFIDGVSVRRTTLISALAHRVPVVGVKGPSTDKVFKHGENIFLISQRDSKELSKIIDLLLSNPSLREAIAKGGEEVYRRFFDWNIIAENIVMVYKKVL